MPIDGHEGRNEEEVKRLDAYYLFYGAVVVREFCKFIGDFAKTRTHASFAREISRLLC